jgi:hypothetical protein
MQLLKDARPEYDRWLQSQCLPMGRKHIHENRRRHAGQEIYVVNVAVIRWLSSCGMSGGYKKSSTGFFGAYPSGLTGPSSICVGKWLIITDNLDTVEGRYQPGCFT